MAELNDMNDEVLPVAVPVIQRRRGRRRRDQEHPAQLHEFAWHAVGGVENDPAGAALELENEILAANLRFEGALANPVSPYLFDLIRQDCTCTVTVLRPGATGCQRIVERCRTHPEETFYQDPRMGRNPLHVACSKNACLHAIESILQANDETNVAVFRDETGNTPLHLLFCGYRTRHMGKTEMLAVMDLLLQPAAASFALRANIAGCLPVHYACSAPESMIHAEAVEKLLVASPECVSRGNNKGQWPLHFHCERRQASTNLARILLQAAPEAALVLDQTQRQGWSPLHYAAWNLNSDLIRFLVATADGNAVASLRSSQTGETALHVLCRRGPTVHQLAAVGALLAAAPDTATQRAAGQKSFTPLHLLCRVRDVPVAIVRAIVEVAPQALRIADDNQYLPLHYACEFGADPEVIACLLEGFPGATKHLTRKNDTALSLACSVNLSGETAQLLLDAHPEALLQKNDYGFNPLHCVCRSYQPKVAIAKAIIDKNPAIVTEQTNAGETAIHLASSSTGGSVGLLEVLTAARVASGAMNVVALDKKVMVNKVGNTPLHYACFRNVSLDNIETLAMTNPEWISVCNNAGYSPLQILCKQGRIDDRIVTLFSRVGSLAVFSTVDLGGNTPLHSAVREETGVEALRALICAYPEALRMKTIFDDTPLHLACIRRLSAEAVRKVALASSHGLEVALAHCNGRISPLLAQNTAGQTPIVIAVEEFRRVSHSCCCVGTSYNTEQQRAFDVLATLVKILYYGPRDSEANQYAGDDSKQGLVLACLSLHRRGIRLDPLFIRGALNRFPEEARCVDEEGNYPLHIEAGIPIEKMSLLDGHLYSGCEGGCHQRIGILRILLEIYPEATQSRTPSGNFGLGLMIQNGRPWDGTFALAVRTFPQAFHCVRGIKSKLTPRIVEKVYNECGIDTLFAFIHTRPDLVSDQYA